MSAPFKYITPHGLLYRIESCVAYAKNFGLMDHKNTVRFVQRCPDQPNINDAYDWLGITMMDCFLCFTGGINLTPENAKAFDIFHHPNYGRLGFYTMNLFLSDEEYDLISNCLQDLFVGDVCGYNDSIKGSSRQDLFPLLPTNISSVMNIEASKNKVEDVPKFVREIRDSFI